MEFLNGRPRLLDHNGKVIPERRERDGDMNPGGIALPHGITFMARTGGASNTYWHDRFDEALKHGREHARSMENDAWLMALVEERKRSVIPLPWHLEVPDNRNPRQRQVRDGVTRLINSMGGLLRRLFEWLLDAIWYGRFAVQVEWAWTHFDDYPPEGKPPVPRGKRRKKRYAMGPEGEDGPPIGDLLAQVPPTPGPAVPGVDTRTPQPKPPKSYRIRGLKVAEAWPVHGDKIGHRYDHTPYILVNAAETDRLDNSHIITTTKGMALVLEGTWRERFIIHRHKIKDAAFDAPEEAEGIHGVGIRSGLFWNDWLKREWLANVTDFFDRVGLGTTIWTYEKGNPQAKAAVEEAARDQSNKAHIFVPVEPGQERHGIERMEVPTTGADALLKLIQYMDDVMERFVVGQQASSRGTSSGMGNEAGALFQMGTKAAVTMQDAMMLAATLTGTEREPGLVNVIKRCTYPWAKDIPLSFVFDVEKPESAQKLQALRTLVELGAKVRLDDVMAAAGFGKPMPGDELVEPPQQPGAPGAGGPPGMPGAGGPPVIGTPPPGMPAPEGQDAGAVPQDMLDVLRMAKRPSQRAAALAAQLKANGQHEMARRVAIRYARREKEAAGG